ncbi:hypothetical protein ACO0LG_24935 [Undibacterium sp. Ji42W]|uniref:hypothetical protein n=1 Tax=Undibacterium sp. Ji42W TaxID=3413039 RepID=UPI003BF31504
MNHIKFGKIFVLVTCIVFPCLAWSATYQVDPGNKVLRMTGEIVDEDAKQIEEYLGTGIETIIVRSGGGSVVGALEIAKEINKRKINLIVDKYCLSSCANYLFIAAYKKSLLPESVLGFHGGVYGKAPIQGPKSGKSKKGNMSMESFWKKDSRFFQEIGFNKDLLKRSYALTEPEIKTRTYEVTARGDKFKFSSESEAAKFLSELMQKKEKFGMSVTVNGSSETTAYFPDEKTLVRYGVKGIENYPYPKDKQEMELLAKTISGDFQLVGDF